MKLKSIILAFAGLAMFTSCQTDEPSNILAEYQKPTSFVLNKPQFSNGVYDLLNAGTVNFTFSQPNYGYSAVCDYTVEVSKDETFEVKSAISTVYHKCNIDVDANEFAMAVCSAYGWVSQKEIDAYLSESETGIAPVYVRIVSKISNELIKESEIVSNSVSINTIPYFALPPVEMPTKMYMIGGFCGWDWANAAPMVPIHSNIDKFWCIRYVKEGEGFKFNTNTAWDGGEFGFAGTTCQTTVPGLEFKDDGGNIAVSKAGWYIFGITTKIVGRDYQYTLDVFPANVYVFGPTNGNIWEAKDEWMFTVPADSTGDFVSPTLVESGELRLCINPKDATGGQWAGDWWHTEFIFFEGKIAYRGAGNDQERVQAQKGQKVYLNFVTGKASAK